MLPLHLVFLLAAILAPRADAKTGSNATSSLPLSAQRLLQATAQHAPVLDDPQNLALFPSQPEPSPEVLAPSPPPKAAAFLVSGAALPLLPSGTHLQDSYAGRLPISNQTRESTEYFFWYWPTSASTPSDSLVIWLNGGPGCSSLFGAFVENGPLTFKFGQNGPAMNPNTWTSVTDVLYVEQPAGVGFSTGIATFTGETPLADAFYGFLTQFYGVFPQLVSRKLYITGESYAGMYIPYISHRILSASPLEKTALQLNLTGILINDGVYSSQIVSRQAPIARFVSGHQTALGFSDDFVQRLHNQSISCGYDNIIANITYPPPGPFVLPPVVSAQCDVYDQFYAEANNANPCFNIYRVTDTCPSKDPTNDVEAYLSRPDVQQLLHLNGTVAWEDCSADPFVRDIDTSPFSETIFPSLLSALSTVTLWHGLDDSILLAEGTRITIQNLVWNGKQGFQTLPSDKLLINGQERGTFHTERGLTYIEVENAGHMIPADQPDVALQVLRYVLGQVSATDISGAPASASGGGGSAASSGRKRVDGRVGNPNWLGLIYGAAMGTVIWTLV